MRTLFILRGAPGSGKSTLIRHHRLSELALGLDDFRRLYSTPFTDLDGQPTLSMAYGAERKVVAAYKDAVETRLQMGATLLLDATNPNRRSWGAYAEFAERCGYTVHVINVQGDLDDDELLARNATRRGTIDYVTPQAVTSIAAKVRGAGALREPVVGFEDVRRLNTLVERDLTGVYDRLVLIGDVQSCAGALDKVRRHYGGWASDTLFVLTGDLFDRGPDAAGVLDVLGEPVPDNVVLVEGNHDEHLRHVVGGLPGARWSHTRTSLEQILASGRTKRDVTDLLGRMRPALALRFAGRSWLVTHAGLDAVTLERVMSVDEATGLRSYDLTTVPMRQLLLGSSSREQTYLGRSDYDRDVEALLSHAEVVQVHGHRNGTRDQGPGPERAAPNVVTLEHGVENGGHLSVLEVRADGVETILTFTDEPLAGGERAQGGWCTEPGSLMARMVAHPEVRIRDVEGLPGVVACNFTRRAFVKGVWDETSCKARGLFLQARSSRVVARGYDKFFNLGQAPGPADLGAVVRAGEGMPLTVRRKWNGFLAIVAVVDGSLRVLSKAGVTPYAQLAHEMLLAHLGPGEEELAGLLEEAGASLTFEVISRRDPHIVDEGEDKVVLLDAVRNQEQMELIEPLRLEVAERFGFISPQVEVISQAAGREDVEALAARARASEEARDEGFVISYGQGLMTKYKSRYYSEVKAFRALLERSLAGREVRPGSRGWSLYERYLDHGETSEFLVPDPMRPGAVDIPALVRSL
ncbi:RNA ligase [Actinomyces howellii]|nr:RNA ligase [Actinomyces howellii]